MISCSYHRVNWAHLPKRIIDGIVDRLILVDDYVNFGAVCVSWRTAFNEDKEKKRSQSSFPFLLVRPHDLKEEEEEEEEEEETQELINGKRRAKSLNRPRHLSTYNGIKLFREGRKRKSLVVPQTRSLYNILSQKVCSDFDVKLPHDYYCRGSSFGWLVTMKAPIFNEFGYYEKYYVQLYNPFLSDKRNIINLPPLEYQDKDKDAGLDPRIIRPFFYLIKAVLSCNPLFAHKPNNFVVMAIVSQVCKLAFYTPENKDWITINCEKEDWSYFWDVIYFNKTRQFYAVLGTGAVLAIELITEAGRAPRIIPKVTQVAPPTHDFENTALRRYLVETSSGELLQVYKQFHVVNGSSSNNYDVTVQFEVFKLDPAGLAWRQMHDMGDTVLFLGGNSSISRTASDFPGCKPNCIYYTDDMSAIQEVGGPYDPQDMGVYSLADGTHQPHYPTASRINFPAPIWLEPTLPRSVFLDT